MNRFFVPCFLGLSVLLGACAQNKPGDDSSFASRTARLSFTGSKPTDPDSVESQLKRYAGQTKFLNPPSPPMPLMAERGAAWGRREQQESDVFKFGAAGSKLLFLLNHHRGLQAVSFDRGLDQARLIGRAAPTGYRPDQMYAQNERHRLFVLESMRDQGKSRIVTYDVSKPEAPIMGDSLELEGEIADSRIVGEVLYIATNQNTGGAVAKGRVYAVNVSGVHPRLHAQSELKLAVSRRENMNIVEIKEGDAYKYYLLAVLSESGWGWWDRKSLIEVVDISDPHGAIKPLMVVSTKGRIDERSQAFIKNNTLIAVSTYGGEWQSGTLARIAVETFNLPAPGAEFISADEAEFRRLNIERQLKGLSGDALEERRAQLVGDATLGLRGRFVQDGATLKKPLPDSAITTGDTHGLHARLQDVRASDERLYVFWVPQNQMDPLDVFDLRAPERGLPYLSHLEFDGWIERAEPFSYQDRQYILGLGHIVPAVNNETNRRHPQAALFEITPDGKASVRAQLTLKNSWVDFNAADKFVEVSFSAEGRGEILFKADDWQAERYRSGAQLVNFDLSQPGVFSTGQFLAGDASWLRRVFRAPESHAIHAFSDRQLNTFAATTHVLELARDMQAYERLNSSLAVQIIQGDDQVILRTTDPQRADAERSEVLFETSFEGAYDGHFVNSADASLWIVTRLNNGKKHLGRWTTEGNRLALSDQVELAPSSDHEESIVAPAGLRRASDHEVWLGAGRNLWVVRITNGKFQIQSHSLSKMGDTVRNPHWITLEGRTYLTFFEQVEDPKRADLFYERHFLQAFTIDAQGAKFGPAVNIPGEPAALLSANQLVTTDRLLLDTTEREGSTQIHSQEALAALSLDAKAVLNDLCGSEGTAMFRFGANSLAFLESKEGTRLVKIRLDEQQRFVREVEFLDEGLSDDAQLLGTFEEGDHSLALVASDKQLRVLRFASGSTPAQWLKLRAVNPRFEREKESLFVPLMHDFYWGRGWGWGWARWAPHSIHFDREARSFELSLGLYGVTQVELAD